MGKNIKNVTLSFLFWTLELSSKKQVTFSTLFQELTNTKITLSDKKDIFTHVALKAVETSVLNHSLRELSSARRQNMADGYRTVSKRIMNSVLARFRLDFELFRYEPKPRDLFQR